MTNLQHRLGRLEAADEAARRERLARLLAPANVQRLAELLDYAGADPDTLRRRDKVLEILGEARCRKAESEAAP